MSFGYVFLLDFAHSRFERQVAHQFSMTRGGRSLLLIEATIDFSKTLFHRPFECGNALFQGFQVRNNQVL